MNNLIETLIETRVNGNSIKGNKTYENILKRITYKEIVFYGECIGFVVTGRTKLDAINSIANKY